MAIQKPVTICMTQEQQVALSKLSKRTGFSQSAIIRCALDRFLSTTRHQRTRWAIKQLEEVGQTAPQPAREESEGLDTLPPMAPSKRRIDHLRHQHGGATNARPCPAESNIVELPTHSRRSPSSQSHDTTNLSTCGIRSGIKLQIDEGE
jgi:predicted DNA-binding protein